MILPPQLLVAQIWSLIQSLLSLRNLTQRRCTKPSNSPRPRTSTQWTLRRVGMRRTTSGRPRTRHSASSLVARFRSRPLPGIRTHRSERTLTLGSYGSRTLVSFTSCLTSLRVLQSQSALSAQLYSFSLWAYAYCVCSVWRRQ